ncbi:MAG TPA: AmmeMemoRadiSam system protein B [Terriglobales bacterium]|jgi:AmmeMemoRadiSam system protein B|nr:AmmeMemoRadiSam system protein B [Terriglobales bacterium]
MKSPSRAPAVAGRFYPRSAEELRRNIAEYTSPGETPKTSAIGCIAPHAGYIYSGHVAGAIYSRMEIPRRVIVLGPNHTGMGHPLAIMTNTAWETPLGKVAADAELGGALLQRFPLLREDSAAHRSEHAIEVQLPFLQMRRPDLSLVPITIGTREFDILRALGIAIADAVAAQPEKVLVIASSDMNHYESDAVTRLKDHKAIAQVLAMDARGLWEVVQNEDISMCGFGPSVAMLTAAKRLGAKEATLVKYATSGEVSGDYDRVVGYAGIVVS